LLISNEKVVKDYSNFTGVDKLVLNMMLWLQPLLYLTVIDYAPSYGDVPTEKLACLPLGIV
jgi:hypothetical protein